MDDADIRFESMSDIEALGRSAGSGNAECFESFAMMVIGIGGNLGVSKSSTAVSLLLVLLFGLIPCLQISAKPDVCTLQVEEVRDLAEGLADGGGIEMLARSE